jgi:UDPglucose 6-dehydrogenase
VEALVHPKIVVVGTGYLGATHAACMAELGYEVLGIDIDPVRVDRLRAGDLPFFEPRLSELLRRHLSSGRLRFSRSWPEAASFGDVFFICVGTPQSTDGLAANVEPLFAAVERLAPALLRPTLIVGKSTVPVGTARALAALADTLAPEGVDLDVAWNPEFLREGHAVQDTLSPERLVLGVASNWVEKVLREIYAPLIDQGVPVVVTDMPTAELVKSAANAFLATKISFINVMAEMCEAAGADVLALADALGYDDRIGRRCLRPGAGFGGGCLPKDTRALVARADELGVGQASALMRLVDEINLRCRQRVVEAALEECGGIVAGLEITVLGAAFKPHTDDVRDSPALDIAVRLQHCGARVRVYDPQANANALAVAPTLQYAATTEEAIRGADLVLHLTDWPEFSRLDPSRLAGLVRQTRLIDGRNTLDAEHWRSAGWSVRAIGRPVEAATLLPV